MGKVKKKKRKKIFCPRTECEAGLFFGTGGGVREGLGTDGRCKYIAGFRLPTYLFSWGEGEGGQGVYIFVLEEKEMMLGKDSLLLLGVFPISSVLIPRMNPNYALC